jgi:hypothetical protein
MLSMIIHNALVPSQFPSNLGGKDSSSRFSAYNTIARKIRVTFMIVNSFFKFVCRKNSASVQSLQICIVWPNCCRFQRATPSSLRGIHVSNLIKILITKFLFSHGTITAKVQVQSVTECFEYFAP